jgi:glycerophosphoryl diester phosphodiesterase
MLRAERRPWVLQSFDPANLLEVRARDPGAPTALLIEDAAALSRAAGEAWRGINADHVLLNADVVGSMRARQMAVGAWTVNTPEDLRRAIALGLDWLITDEPLVARELCNGMCD